MARPISSPVTVLKRARTLIETGWCRKHCAVTKSGADCYPTDPRAARFCATGAPQAIKSAPGVLSKALAALDRAARINGYHGTITLNDTSKSKKRVLNLYDDAIKLARKGL